MIRILCFLILSSPFMVAGQDKLGKNKGDIKGEINKWINENGPLSPRLTETDSTLVLQFKDPVHGAVSSVYGFNRDKLCITEKTSTACADCINYYLNKVLEQKNYQWKKINGNQYISRFADQALVELPVDEKDFSFTIFRAQWTKELYDLLNSN